MCSSPKAIILKEIENIYRNAVETYNNNERNQNYICTEFDAQSKKNSSSNTYLSKKNSKNNLDIDIKKINISKNVDKNNKDIIEKELNILNKKYNQIKEENINLKYLITEKTTAFEDVKNSLKNFQNEINQLKNNNNNHNSFRNKNSEKNDENNSNVIINSKGLEMKNVTLNLSNIQRVNEIKDLNCTKNKQKEINDENNLLNCNNYSFGQNNSLEINLENNNKKDFLNSNKSIDLLSLTFHDNIDELQPSEIGQDINIKNYDFSPSLRKATEILIQTGMMPDKNDKK